MKLTANTQSKTNKTIYTDTPLPMVLIRVVFLIYLFLLLVVLPLVFHNGYVDIADTKWKYYKLFTVGYISDYGIMIFPGCAVILIALFIWYAIDKKRNGIPFRKPLITDYFVIAYMIACCISTILAPVKNVVWEGYPGYYMGLYAQLSFCLLYIFSSHICNRPAIDNHLSSKSNGIKGFLTTDKYLERIPYIIIALMMIGSAPVMYIGIENAIGKDVFKMAEISGTEIGTFRTTIGNVGIYAEYVTIMLIAGIYVFCYTNNLLITVISGVWLVIAFTAAICANAAAGALGTVVVLFVFFIFSFRSSKRFIRYMLIIAILGVSFLITGRIAYDEMGTLVLMTESLLVKVIEKKLWLILIIGGISLAILGYAVSALIGKKIEQDKKSVISTVLQVLISFLGIFSVFAVLLYIKLNTDGKLPSWIPASSNPYLLFTNDWGSFRLYMWRNILARFREVYESNMRLRIFGLGPDNLYILPGMTELASRVWGANSIIAYAHNELINIYVNIGIFGIVSYIGIFATASLYLIINHTGNTKNRKNHSPARVMALAGLFGYLAQGFFGYQWVCVTTAAFILIGAGMAQYRDR